MDVFDDRYYRNRKTIKDLSPEEQENQRQKWRSYYQKRASKKKSGKSPQETKIENLKRKIEALEALNNKRKKQVQKYKKRCQRAKQKENAAILKIPDRDLSPKSKTKKMLLTLNSKDKKKLLPKVLLTNNVILQSIKKKYVDVRNRKTRQTLKEVLSSQLVKKYRLQSHMMRSAKLNIVLREKKSFAEKIKRKMELITLFYCRDDVSRATAGKKEVLTKNKIKYQKRYLNDDLKVLFEKFKRENPSEKVSYSTFTRYRPFYVLFPDIKDRNTCACKKHSNFVFKVKRLHACKILKTDKYREVVDSLMCSEKTIKCAYNLCQNCKSKKIEFLISEEYDDDTEISFFEWNVKEKKVGKKGGTKKVSEKELKTATISDLKKMVEEEAVIMKRHLFNIENQAAAYNKCKDNIKEDEAIIHCDFSENYKCKLHEEIQSFHFGSSRNSASLHTVVVYLKNRKPIPICTISKVTDHEPHGIWAHLIPVINFIKKDCEINLKNLYVFSDGPSSQYRQKKNYFLFQYYLKFFDIKHGIWSFFESSHGKGAADGIGAIVKRTADSIVSKNSDIPNAKALFEKLKEKLSIKLFYIDDEAFKEVSKNLPETLVALPGNNRLHQLYTDGKTLKFRDASCYCEKNDLEKEGSEKLCDCTFPYKTGSLFKPEEKTKPATKKIILSRQKKGSDCLGETLQVKAKRGRKRKIGEGAINHEENSILKKKPRHVQENEESEPPGMKKKRGRPRKVVNEN